MSTSVRKEYAHFKDCQFNKVAIFNGIGLIQVACSSLPCTLSLYFGFLDTTSSTPRGDSENYSTARRMELIPRESPNTTQPTVRTPSVNLIDGVIHNQTKCGFSFAHLNVRSIVNKMDQFRVLMSKKPFDVICLNETFCDSSI